MRNGLFTPIRNMLAKKRKHKLWLRIVSFMMAIVVFCTTYMLILPAITLETQKTYCGVEEHTHTDECYASSTEVENRELGCNPTADVDFVIHKHNELCYNGAGELRCTLPELEEHIHNDDCYIANRELTCGLEESEGHTHSDECYERVQGEMICTDTSPEHTHTDDCYAWSDELICGLEESEGHTHDDSCYTEDRELICGIVEVEPHIHNDSCRDGNGVLFCGKPQVTEHEHTEDCLAELKAGAEATEATAGEATSVAQTVAEGSDAATEDNSDKVLICGKQEHKHTDECYTAPDSGSGSSGAEAQKETKADGTTEVTTTVEQSTEITTAAVEESEDKELSFPYADDNITGIVTIPYSKSLPDDLDCNIIPITGTEENYDKLNDTVDKALTSAVQQVEMVQLYRLEWTSDNNIYELPSGIVPKVNVSVLERANNESVKGLVLSEKLTTEQRQELKEDLGLESPIELLPAISLDAALNAPEEDSLEAEESIADTVEVSEQSEEDTVSEDDMVNDEVQADEEGEFITPYAVEKVNAELDGNSLEMSLSSLETFAVAKVVYASNNSSNAYYERVDDISEINSTDTYMLVMANHEVAVGTEIIINGTSKISKLVNTPVEIRPVANNPKYFEIIDANSADKNYIGLSGDYSNILWNFIPTGRSATADSSADLYDLRRIDSSSEQVGSLYGYLFMVKQYDMYLERATDSDGVWHILNTDATRTFYSNTATDGSVSVGCYSAKSQITSNREKTQMLIFKYVSDATNEMNEVINDEDEADGITDDSGAESEYMSKPVYERYKATSAAKSGSAELGSESKLAGATVEYASDTSTSAIEKKFGSVGNRNTGNTLYAQQEENDGRVMSDKSVIHGKDDYGALQSNDLTETDFSVTLSALGQEWRVKDTATIPTALDVVFVLDLSQSMYKSLVSYQGQNTASDFDEDGNYIGSDEDESDTDTDYTDSQISVNTERWKESADAINSAMHNIMYGDGSEEEREERQYNRVGLVTYSDTAYEMLALDRYTATDDKYLTYTDTGDESDYQTFGVADSMADSTGKAPSCGGKSFKDYTGMWDATYTQRGIQGAYDIFSSATNKSFGVTLSNGSSATVKRKPVVILVTDGDPTICSYNYMDPMSGPNYGVGESYGIIGYYTILSANYFKNMTSISYNKPAAFYTIGIGIKDEGHGTKDDNIEDCKVTVDNAYMRAVLNPTEDNIKELDNDTTFWTDNDNGTAKAANAATAANRYWTLTSQKLRALLTGKMETASGSKEYEDFNASTFTQELNVSDGYNPDTGAYLGTQNVKEEQPPLGYTVSTIRGMVLPYKDYDYCNEAYFGELTEEDLEDIFESIVKMVDVSNDYNFLLKENTYVLITDYIGAGMEVKSEPTLRYFGTNYGSTYRHKGTGTTTLSGEAYTFTRYYWDVTVNRQENDVKSDEENTLNLKGILFYVYTNVQEGSANKGTQFVRFYIPDSLFPTYYPDLAKLFYFEELPARVIYVVGLSEAEEEKLAENKTIENAVYYTNMYDSSSNSKFGKSLTTYTPSSGNPWVDNNLSTTSATGYKKVDNVTNTTVYSSLEYKNTSGKVIQTLGNNGKLVINKEDVQYIKVDKKWEDEHEGIDSVTVNLYAKGTVTDGDTTTNGTWLLDTVTLNDANSWSYTWDKLPRSKTEDTVVYSYDNFFISEEEPEGYGASYQDSSGVELSGEVLKLPIETDGSAEAMVQEISAANADGGSVIITNKKLYALPESGGIGTGVFTSSAVALLTATGFMYIFNKRRQKRVRREAM